MIETRRILIVEDEADNLELLNMMLGNMGYNTDLANDGMEALELLEKNLPDLVISDVMMPRLNGFELCKRIKDDENTRLIPVVLLTGLDSTEDRIHGIKAGADDFISKPFHLEELQARVGSLIKLKQFTDELEHAEKVIFSLALAVEAKDPYTKGHCQRLSDHGVEVGRRLGLDDDELQSIRRGGIIHDIGKICISEAILLKPGPLTESERKTMQEHPKRGEGVCKPMRSLSSTLPIIRNHHERVDGKGYPDGLKVDDIPIGAQVIAAVDLCDALVTDRPYRRAMPINEVVKMLDSAEETGHLDPKIVSIVREIIGEIGEDWVDKYQDHYTKLAEEE